MRALVGRDDRHVGEVARDVALGGNQLAARRLRASLKTHVPVVDGAAIEVTYTFRLDGDLPQGEGNGRAVATYTWDGAGVLMDGEVPPDSSGS